MMRAHFEKLRKAIWILKQPLTRKPTIVGTPVSDLFVWRCDESWETFFELTDIAGLFAEDAPGATRHAMLYTYDDKGAPLLEKRLEVAPNRRQTIALAEFLPRSHGGIGTFCIFHSHTPSSVSELGSFISERGYVSYRYRRAPLRAYVHGNLDAIALHPQAGAQLLGSGSLLMREYRVQHELRGPARYDVGLVNPSRSRKMLTCRVVDARSGSPLQSLRAQLAPGGCHVFSVDVDSQRASRVVIASSLVMPRPVIFRISNQQVDVFHG
jgi:hypothetical protein